MNDADVVAAVVLDLRARARRCKEALPLLPATYLIDAYRAHQVVRDAETQIHLDAILGHSVARGGTLMRLEFVSALLEHDDRILRGGCKGAPRG